MEICQEDYNFPTANNLDVAAMIINPQAGLASLPNTTRKRLRA